MPVDLRKETKFGAEARKELMKGIDTLADAVVSTLGPNGRNVLIDQHPSLPQSTKDGVTVAKNIFVDGNIQNLGVQVIKAAAMKTADKVPKATRLLQPMVWPNSPLRMQSLKSQPLQPEESASHHSNVGC